MKSKKEEKRKEEMTMHFDKEGFRKEFFYGNYFASPPEKIKTVLDIAMWIMQTPFWLVYGLIVLMASVKLGNA